MILKKIGGKNFVVNLLSDFILNKIGLEHSSEIYVLDVNNFFIVKGRTSSKEVLNLSEVINEFKQKFDSFLNQTKITNTIDLLEYDVEMKKINRVTQTLFNTESCSYHYKQIENFERDGKSWDLKFIPHEISENEPYYSSEFPHGFSYDQGRLLYYYLKKIFYSLPSSYPFTSLTLTISPDDENFIKVYNNFSQSYDEVFESAILDSVDLNLEKFEKQISNIEFENELLYPLKEHDILKDDKFDIIII